MSVFTYRGKLYPEYIRQGNATGAISNIAKHFCTGRGLDIGSNQWPLEGAIAIDNGEFNADNLPLGGPWDFIYSSHCLEHLRNPINTLEYWKRNIRPQGCLFLYLPHPDMEYWLPQNCRKHLHTWTPEQMAKIVEDLGFYNVIHSQRDMYWSFAVVAFVPEGEYGPLYSRDEPSSR